MIVTINRAHRDALHHEMLTDLTALGDIFRALNAGQGEEAQRLWHSHEPELQLLDQIGWNPVERLEQFEIDLPQDILLRVLAQLQERAEEITDIHITEPREGAELAQRTIQVLAACHNALSRLADQQAGKPS
jgi:hypothetical protein